MALNTVKCYWHSGTQRQSAWM